MRVETYAFIKSAGCWWEKADFIEPCQQCGEFDVCEADWSETTKLIMKESGYLDCD